MKYFDEYTSNTVAGSSNQFYFTTERDRIHTGRIFYKISCGGEYDYSVLFSNIIDSTYADGTYSHKNMICKDWRIEKARIGKCSKFNYTKDICSMIMDDKNKNSDIVISEFKDVTFGGLTSRGAAPGEFLSSDPVTLDLKKDEYLCVEVTFSGEMIPYHEESLLPVFLKKNGVWKYSKYMPFPAMIGCNRKVRGRIAYLGDSITQGVGTKPNSYRHWNAILSEKLGEEYAYWNLGIGYGRANDVASDGSWLFKAKQNDIVFVCFGVNDILNNHPKEQIIADLTYVVKTLKKDGKKVIVQTVPPFNYEGETIDKWKSINSYITNDISEIADFVFDNTHILGEKDNIHRAKYGGHPNEAGCKVWADALFDKIRENGIL